MADKSPGQIAFEGYQDEAYRLQGLDCLPWDARSPTEVQLWEAAAKRVQQQVISQLFRGLGG